MKKKKVTAYNVYLSAEEARAIVSGKRNCIRRYAYDTCNPRQAGDFLRGMEPFHRFRYADVGAYGYDYLADGLEGYLKKYWEPAGGSYETIYGEITREELKEKYNNFKWSPAARMPKRACRLLLKITNIREQPLSSLSTEQKKEVEGIRADRVVPDKVLTTEFVIVSQYEAPKKKEHSICLSADDVRAILEGTKTHLRRVIENRSGGTYLAHKRENPRFRLDYQEGEDGSGWGVEEIDENDNPLECYTDIKKPYDGSAGEILWVKEPVCLLRDPEADMLCPVYLADGFEGFLRRFARTEDERFETPEGWKTYGELKALYSKFKGSFAGAMKRYSRLSLRITGVTLQPLSELTEEQKKEVKYAGELDPSAQTITIEFERVMK